MPLNEPITPGVVDWTGENPGILLKNEDGSFAAMALFFGSFGRQLVRGRCCFCMQRQIRSKARLRLPM